jgi:predicted AlkP superfamily pyrophosphatase or phosphodiesterase
MNRSRTLKFRDVALAFMLFVGNLGDTSLIGEESTRLVGPKLIVVVSIDQMCADYLIRFERNFPLNPEKSFFRSVIVRGASFPNCNHAHAFTYTAPGHAVQLTGCYPNDHGVIDNDWFDRETGKSRYCVSDPSVKVVGISSEKPMSPRVLLVDTVGDMLKLATNGKAKVFGVAIKDRAAILMSGHRADAAFWLEENQWVTSTYYRDDLPGYLRVLNDGHSIDQYRGMTWDLSLPHKQYCNQGDDDSEFENPPVGFTAAFPHKLVELGESTPDKYGDQVLFSPYGNEYTLLAARTIIENEKLGEDEIPDLLTINFSSNDYIGHAFGPLSLEVEDMTYRTDWQLAEFAKYLDQTVGAGEWTIAVTADHGVAPIPESIAKQPTSGQEIPAAKRNPLGDLKTVQKQLEFIVRQSLGIDAPFEDPSQKIILDLDVNQLYLNRNHPDLKGENLLEARRIVRDWLLEQRYVAGAATYDDLLGSGESRLLHRMRLSFNSARSGDVLFVYTPYAIPGNKSANAKPRGTTHGSPWHYDTHVPLLLAGKNIKPGRYVSQVSPAHLAPTISRLFGVNAPGGCVVRALEEAIVTSER